jgi:hypothetical protein
MSKLSANARGKRLNTAPTTLRAIQAESQSTFHKTKHAFHQKPNPTRETVPLSRAIRNYITATRTPD